MTTLIDVHAIVVGLLLEANSAIKGMLRLCWLKLRALLVFRLRSIVVHNRGRTANIIVS